MTHTDMTKPLSTNPKLADWVPSEQQTQTITVARALWNLVPEEVMASVERQSPTTSLPS